MNYSNSAEKMVDEILTKLGDLTPRPYELGYERKAEFADALRRLINIRNYANVCVRRAKRALQLWVPFE